MAYQGGSKSMGGSITGRQLGSEAQAANARSAQHLTRR